MRCISVVRIYDLICRVFSSLLKATVPKPEHWPLWNMGLLPMVRVLPVCVALCGYEKQLRLQSQAQMFPNHFTFLWTSDLEASLYRVCPILQRTCMSPFSLEVIQNCARASQSLFSSLFNCWHLFPPQLVMWNWTWKCKDYLLLKPFSVNVARSLMTNSNSLFLWVSEGELEGGVFAVHRLEAQGAFWYLYVTVSIKLTCSQGCVYMGKWGMQVTPLSPKCPQV